MTSLRHRICELLREQARPMHIGPVACKLNEPEVAVSNAMRKLCKSGYLERVERGGYRHLRTYVAPVPVRPKPAIRAERMVDSARYAKTELELVWPWRG